MVGCWPRQALCSAAQLWVRAAVCVCCSPRLSRRIAANRQPLPTARRAAVPPTCPALQQPMLEWLANSYKKFGCLLEFVTDRSEEGNQFCKGFGGIGGVLRYSVRLGQQQGAGRG